MLPWDVSSEVSPQTGGAGRSRSALEGSANRSLIFKNHSKTTPLLAAEGFMIQLILIRDQIVV